MGSLTSGLTIEKETSYRFKIKEAYWKVAALV